ITHWRSLKSAPRSRSIDGSATFTIVTSSSSMKIAMQLASRVHHLRSTGFRDYMQGLRQMSASAHERSPSEEESTEVVVPPHQRRRTSVDDGGGGNRTRVRNRPVQSLYKLRLPLRFAR